MSTHAHGPGSQQSHLPTLKELCSRVVNANLSLITSFGSMSYDMALPFLSRMDAEQLRTVEENSPHLIDYTDDIWRKLCMKDFADVNKAYASGQLDTPASWRDFHEDVEAQRAAKLADLQRHLKKTYKAIADDKEEKSIRVIAKPEPKRMRGASSTRQSGSLLQKARRAAEASRQQFKMTSPTSAFAAGSSSSDRPRMSGPSTTLRTTALSRPPNKPLITPPRRTIDQSMRASAPRSDPSFFGTSGSTLRTSVGSTSSPAAVKRTQLSTSKSRSGDVRFV